MTTARKVDPYARGGGVELRHTLTELDRELRWYLSAEARHAGDPERQGADGRYARGMDAGMSMMAESLLDRLHRLTGGAFGEPRPD